SGIVPIVIHHGACPWPNTAWGSPPTIEGDPAVEAELQRFHPELRYLLFDLARCSEADLMVRDMTALGRLTLLSLQFLRQFSDDEALAAIDRWRDLIGAVHAAPGGHANLEAVWCYFLQVTDLTTERLADTVARVLQNPDEDSVMSTADKLIAKGRTEGRTEGRAEGRAELLLGLLRKRFGQLPGGVTTRVQQATLEDLELWAERILDARSLADVFAAE
ncbi:MAG TPA: DUF4351 domain-containing protein, partial [Planctomycetota bacterium]|nr:DUF4351 domain-containing protein [Planctomycetota bacterium]